MYSSYNIHCIYGHCTTVCCSDCSVESLGTCNIGNMEKAVHCKCIDQGKYRVSIVKQFFFVKNIVITTLNKRNFLFSALKVGVEWENLMPWLTTSFLPGKALGWMYCLL